MIVYYALLYNALDFTVAFGAPFSLTTPQGIKREVKLI